MTKITINSTITKEKIRDAINAIPGAKENLEAKTVDLLASHIVKFDPRVAETAKEYRRRFEPASTSATKRELLELVKAYGEFTKALNNLHKPAREALGWSYHTTLEAEIWNLQWRLVKAESPHDLPTPSKRRVNANQALLAAEAARVYQFSSGKPPARTVSLKGIPGGPFHIFLGAIFAAFEIKKGPDAAARKAIADMEADKPFSG